MKRLLLLTILIGLLFTSPNSFAQSSKPKRATIKYENGVKYVGEIRKGSPKKYSEYALIQKIFDLLVKTGAETPQKQENATL